jgi:hypothetical protein
MGNKTKTKTVYFYTLYIDRYIMSIGLQYMSIGLQYMSIGQQDMSFGLQYMSIGLQLDLDTTNTVYRGIIMASI